MLIFSFFFLVLTGYLSNHLNFLKLFSALTPLQDYISRKQTANTLTPSSPAVSAEISRNIRQNGGSSQPADATGTGVRCGDGPVLS